MSAPPTHMEAPRFRARRLFAVPLARMLEDQLKPICQRQGFAEHRLLTEWRHIVGPLCARYSIPHKIAFRGARKATLHLYVAPSHALELQYRQEEMLERITRYFGHAAVERIFMLQHHGLFAEKAAPASGGPPSPFLASHQVEALIQSCEDAELRASLMSLGQALTGGAFPTSAMKKE